METTGPDVVATALDSVRRGREGFCPTWERRILSDVGKEDSVRRWREGNTVGRTARNSQTNGVLGTPSDLNATAEIPDLCSDHFNGLQEQNDRRRASQSAVTYVPK